mgnify:CR=1 FL=1
MSFFRKIFRGREGKEITSAASKVSGALEEAPKTAAADVRGPLVKGVLIRARMTEKSNAGMKENKYTFVAGNRANKIQIARAVEARYGVNVCAVHVIAARDKMRRRGRQIGWKHGVKKAVVTIKKGQTIEGL